MNSMPCFVILSLVVCCWVAGNRWAWTIAVTLRLYWRPTMFKWWTSRETLWCWHQSWWVTFYCCFTLGWQAYCSIYSWLPLVPMGILSFHASISCRSSTTLPIWFCLKFGGKMNNTINQVFYSIKCHNKKSIVITIDSMHGARDFGKPGAVPGLAFTKSPNRKGLGKGYKGLETFDVSSPILCCFLGQLWQNFQISQKWDLKSQQPSANPEFNHQNLGPKVEILWVYKISVLSIKRLRLLFSEHLVLCIAPFQREEFATFWEKHEWTPLAARNKILTSLCPQVYGLYVVKLAVAMVMAGGVQVSG